jgi:hypothetical protein
MYAFMYTPFFFIYEFVDRRFFTYLIHALLVDASMRIYLSGFGAGGGTLFFVVVYVMVFLAFGGGEWGDGMNEESSFLNHECACAFRCEVTVCGVVEYDGCDMLCC